MDEKKDPKVEFILSTTKPCDLAFSNFSITMEQARARFDQIAEMMSTGPEHLRLSTNFEADELNADKIKRIFRLLNRYFYNQTLFPAIRKKGVKIFWAYFRFDEEPFQPCLKMFAIRKNGSKLDEIHFFVNKNRFHESAKYRITNGVKVRHKLEALCISALHEMTHAITHTFCPSEQGHNKTFLALNSKLHGADPNIYEYRDDVPPDTQKK